MWDGGIFFPRTAGRIMTETFRPKLHESGQSPAESGQAVPAMPEIPRALPDALLLTAFAEFAAGAGHEINNPLATISGRAELLARGESDPARRRELAAIQAQAKRIHAMIVDLMTFARPPLPRPETVDPVAVTRGRLPQWETAAQEKGLRIEFAAEACPGVRIDPGQLGTVLDALLDNALAWSPAGGTIAVRCVPGAIEIEDAGPGWPPEAQGLLFFPFFSGKSAGRGLGTGLSKAWRLLHEQGGNLHLERTPTARTVARVTLPGG